MTGAPAGPSPDGQPADGRRATDGALDAPGATAAVGEDVSLSGAADAPGAAPTVGEDVSLSGALDAPGATAAVGEDVSLSGAADAPGATPTVRENFPPSGAIRAPGATVPVKKDLSLSIEDLSLNIPEQDWERAVSAIAGAGDILLACHVRPDGDALGSMLAVAGALRLRGGRARVVASFGDQPFCVPGLLRFLPGLDLLTPPEQAPPDPEVMITFDVSSVDRLGLLTGQAGRARELIVLDHHPSNPRFGTVNLIDPAAAATAVVAAGLIAGLGAGFTPEIACGLYTGLVTDTGSFRFSTTPQVHGLAARLIAAGVDPEWVAGRLWDSAPFGYLQVLSAALGRAVLEPAAAGRNGLVWTTVTRQDRVAHGGLPAEAAEPVIGELRRSAEADVAIVLKESDDGQWHVSTRSKGRVDVGWVCMQLGGGGHSQAAGFTTEAPVARTMGQLRELLDRAGPARRAIAPSMGESGR